MMDKVSKKHTSMPHAAYSVLCPSVYRIFPPKQKPTRNAKYEGGKEGKEQENRGKTAGRPEFLGNQFSHDTFP